MTNLPGMGRKKGPVVLCVLAGVGVREASAANAFALAETPTLAALLGEHPETRLRASGEAVGLPAGVVGNGEVGHLTLGAGRVVESSRARFDEAIRAGKLSRVPMLDQTVRICMYDDCPLHLFGLLSDGGVHSHIDHLFKLIDIFDFNDVPVVVHAILDGRDAPQRSAMDYLNALEGYIEDKTKTKIGTIAGRHWAMDRDDHWDRVYRAYHAMVRDKQLGPGASVADTPYDAVAQAYLKDIEDDFIEPTRIGGYLGFSGDYLCDFASSATTQTWEWTGLDVGLAFNFRGDRMRQLVGMLTRQGVPDFVADDLLMDRHFPVRAFREHCLTTIASYGDDLGVPVAFATQPVEATLGEVLAAHGLRQLRCAESEKSPHVTHFFSGGREAPFDGESRKVVASPKFVDTFDQKPEMAAAKVADAVVAALEAGEVDFILVNLANADAVAHSGDLEATKKALVAVDAAVGRIRAAVEARRGTLLLTSDHGACESLTGSRGEPDAAHTDNPVPFVLIDDREDVGRAALRDGGSLADVAPTVLDILDIEKPAAMSGTSLRIGGATPKE